MRQRTVFSVTDINLYVKQMFEQDLLLYDVWVRGEISNFKRHSSGHLYFDLKDDRSIIRGIMFRSAALRLPFEPQNGMSVLLRGKVSVYERDGVYQLYGEVMEPEGVGSLHLAFEQLKKKLSDMGLFSEEAKRPLPKFPERIGVITSPTGAAVRDILQILERRYPLAKVVFCPVRVQGDGAAEEIADAITKMSDSHGADVLIVGRGGGSMEDLNAFNDERVAWAIFNAEMPVISAVGHETDFTIADFVADLRSPTPSAAAELAVPSKEELLWKTRKLREGLKDSMDERMETLLGKVLRLKEQLQSPAERVEKAQILCGAYKEQMHAAISQRLSELCGQFGALAGKLSALSPMKVLGRGYAVVSKENGGVVRTVKEVQKEDVLNIRVSDGVITASVLRKEGEKKHGEL